MTEIGETGSRNKADIAGADHGDAHEISASSDAIRKITARPSRDAAPLVGLVQVSDT
jgi:hypothetical protein